MRGITGPMVALALCVPAPLGSRAMGPHLPAPGSDPDCGQSAADPDAVIVCGRSNRGERYRIPEHLRGTGTIDSARASRVANERDARSREDYSAQTTGPFGGRHRARQLGCEWRVARQESQGRQPDCTKKARKDDAADWERSTRRDP